MTLENRLCAEAPGTRACMRMCPTEVRKPAVRQLAAASQVSVVQLQKQLLHRLVCVHLARSVAETPWLFSQPKHWVLITVLSTRSSAFQPPLCISIRS